MNKDEVKKILQENGLHAQAKFGQNFLCDEDILNRILDVSDIRPDSRVLEIGPGIGALTSTILKTSDGSMQYTAVEIDKKLVSYLLSKDEFALNALIIDDDFTKLKPEDYIPYYSFNFVVSNIPYYVMTPIMKKLLTECSTAEKMTFMVEEEALERICAAVGTKQYGPLAVLCAAYGFVKKEFNVYPESFYPAPHTISSVITLTRRVSLDEKDMFTVSPFFGAFVDECFRMRRKTLANNLIGFLKVNNHSSSLQEQLNKLGKPISVRAESLSPSDFVQLYKGLYPDRLI